MPVMPLVPLMPKMLVMPDHHSPPVRVTFSSVFIAGITLQKVMPGWHHFGKSDAGVASLYEKPLALLASFSGTTGINAGILQ